LKIAPARRQPRLAAVKASLPEKQEENLEKDIYLARWSNLLAAMAILAATITMIVLIYPLIFDGPIVLATDHGAKVWNTKLFDIPVFERFTVLILLYLPSFAWLYVVLQVFRLARNYRDGQVFGEINARCFVRIGAALALIGGFETINVPFVAYFLYWRGICPWLADVSWLHLIQPNMFMAGLFFFILGKIMRRASALEENDRLMI